MYTDGATHLRALPMSTTHAMKHKIDLVLPYYDGTDKEGAMKSKGSKLNCKQLLSHQ